MYVEYLLILPFLEKWKSLSCLSFFWTNTGFPSKGILILVLPYSILALITQTCFLHKAFPTPIPVCSVLVICWSFPLNEHLFEGRNHFLLIPLSPEFSNILGSQGTYDEERDKESTRKNLLSTSSYTPSFIKKIIT